MYSKDEIDSEIMNINENCEKYANNLREYTKEVENRFITRRISFYNREDIPTKISLGYVETRSQNQSASFLSDEESIEEHFETLEAQLKEVPKSNHLIIKKSRSANSAFKFYNKVHRHKSIVETRKFSQPYRIIGSEGEEISEFKHPLGA